jgi:hypothetical protein
LGTKWAQIAIQKTRRIVRASRTKRKTRSMSGLPMKRLMGLEPTTFCMAISTYGPDFQHRCGFLADADAVGLPPITGDSDSEWTVRITAPP